jgi:hypothetical protein
MLHENKLFFTRRERFLSPSPTQRGVRRGLNLSTINNILLFLIREIVCNKIYVLITLEELRNKFLAPFFYGEAPSLSGPKFAQ